MTRVISMVYRRQNLGIIILCVKDRAKPENTNDFGSVAQLVEQGTHKPWVGSSILPGAISFFLSKRCPFFSRESREKNHSAPAHHSFNCFRWRQSGGNARVSVPELDPGASFMGAAQGFG